MGLLRDVPECANFNFPIYVLSECHCPSKINANTLDKHVKSKLFIAPLTTHTLLNKVLRYLSFRCTHIYFNPLSVWI